MGMIRVWDLAVRLFHWGLVAAVAVAWLTGDDWDDLHVIAGYCVAGLVAFRLVWGLIGGKYARFSQFVRGPSAVMSYVRDMLARRERRYIGHNPAGAAMILALLITLSGTAFTGWLSQDSTRLAWLSDEVRIVRPARADDDESDSTGGSEIVGDLHELFANGLIILILLHVGGVIFASYRHNENLARAMVTGDKRATAGTDVD